MKKKTTINQASGQPLDATMNIDGVRSRFENIGPAEAMKILEEAKLDESYKNRNLSQSTVDQYASDMRNKLWLPTHQGIAFNVEGTLVDGQHRLWAIIESGCVVTIMVTRGLPLDYPTPIPMSTMDAIDRNRPRTTAQQMGLHGKANTSARSAAGRTIAFIVAGSFHGSMKLTYAQSVGIDELYGSDIDALIPVAEGRISLLPSHILGPVAMYHHAHPERAKDFLRSFIKIENLLDGSPVAALIRFLRNGTGRGGSAREAATCSVCVAIKAFNDGRAIKSIRLSADSMVWLATQQGNDAKKIASLIAPPQNQASK